MKHDWRALHGEKNWDGLLIDPIDVSLRRHIIGYGELAEATYDAFNSEKHSKYAGSCRYGGADFFDRVGLTKGSPKWRHAYKFHSHLYATAGIDVPDAFILRSLSREAWSRESNWMGFVAVSTDAEAARQGHRDIVVAWRGTVCGLEWVDDFHPGKSSVKSLVTLNTPNSPVTEFLRDTAKVQSGWLSIYTSRDDKSLFTSQNAREQVHLSLRNLLKTYRLDALAGRLSLTMAGHSLGGALATLSAFDMSVNGLNRVEGDDRRVPITVVVFASPKVGNEAFKRAVEALDDVRVLRVTNAKDVVPRYPFMGFSHVGKEIVVDTTVSPFVKKGGGIRCRHNLEAYLHGVAGYQGEDKGFHMVVERDVGLVNKYLDWLKDEYLVPESWWVEKNKGMVQGDDGVWRMSEPPPSGQKWPNENDGSGKKGKRARGGLQLCFCASLSNS